MHRLIYRSRAAGAFDRDEIARILATARRVNAEEGVTGLLLYSDRAFLQLLEGDEDTVHATYGRIQDDPRHTDLVVLVDEPADTRQHPDWTMGFHHLDAPLVGPDEDLDRARAEDLLARHADRAVA